MTKLTITSAQIKENLEFRKLINSTPIDEIVLINEYGTKENISEKKINDFKFTGLNNFDFFATEYWRPFK